MPPLPIEEAVKTELPLVSSAVLIGDQRKFLSMLLTLKVGPTGRRGRVHTVRAGSGLGSERAAVPQGRSSAPGVRAAVGTATRAAGTLSSDLCSFHQLGWQLHPQTTARRTRLLAPAVTGCVLWGRRG